MARDQATPPRRPGQRLAYDLCRDLDVSPLLALPSQVLIEALARKHSWMILVQSATPAESLRMSWAHVTGVIYPMQSDVWQIIVHGDALPVLREHIILALLAPLVRGQVPPDGWVHRGLGLHPDDWIGEDFARTLLTECTRPRTTAADEAEADAAALPAQSLLVFVLFPVAAALILALEFFAR